MSKITVDEKAARWFEDELMFEEGAGLRIYGKGYGETNKHVGFSVGIQYGEPENPCVLTEVHHYPYFIEEVDQWFIDGLDLHIGFDDILQEPIYEFSEERN